MFTLKTDITQIKKKQSSPDKKFKVLLNAGGRRFRLYYYVFNESIKRGYI